MDQYAFALRADAEEDFGGASTTLPGGELFDIGEALEKGNGTIVLEPGKGGEEGEYDRQVYNALLKVPSLKPVNPAEAEVDTENGPTLAELQDKAKDLEIEGRSSMDKKQLAKAIAKAEKAAPKEAN